MKCQYCGYQWINRVEEPKACPECKRRFNPAKHKIKKKDSD